MAKSSTKKAETEVAPIEEQPVEKTKASMEIEKAEKPRKTKTKTKVELKSEDKIEIISEVETQDKTEETETENQEAEIKVKTEKSSKSSKAVKHKYPEKIDYRLEQIRFKLTYEKVDGVYVSYLPNIRYLTNFSGSDAHLFIFQDEIIFVTDDRYEEQVKTELYDLPNLSVHISRDVWDLAGKIGILDRFKEIAFEADKLPYQDAVEIRNRIRPVKFKPTPELVEPTTRAKASEELEYIKKSCELSERVFSLMLNYIKPGMTEKEVAIEIAHESRKLGSEGDAFDIIVTSGNRGAFVHGQPTDKKIRKGDIVIIDFGTKINGFCSDITRTICVGAKPTKEQKSIYAILRNAQMKAINAIRPGMNGKVLDRVARSVIEEAGYGEYFKHSLGHGLGLVPHEKPIITFRMDNQNIPEESVLAIEPGIYIPEKFGMRIEDNVYVTKNGAIMLTNAPEELLYIL